MSLRRLQPSAWRPVLVLALLIAALPAAVGSRGSASAACPDVPRVTSTQTLVAHAKRSGLPLFDAPDGQHLRTLSNPTREGQRLHLRVVGTRPDWFRVQYAARPNGTTVWIRRIDVTTSVTPYRIVVQRCSKLIWLFDKGEPAMRFPAAIGKPNTPTPKGD